MEAAEPELPAEDLQMAIEAPSSLLALLTQKRNDARQHLLQTLDNMNNFEEVIAKAILLHQELAQCKEKLRTAETALAEQRVQRFQTGEGRLNIADLGQLSGIIERVEAASRENERLKSDNQYLHQRIQALEKELVDQHSLSHQNDRMSTEIASLKAELQENLRNKAEEFAKLSAEQLQETLRDQLQVTARHVAMKVADVIPLVAHLKVDSEWLNSDTAENLFQLAALGISNVLDSADMRVVARVSLLLAKLLGPCEEMTVFSRDILALIIKNPERGVNLLKNLEAVYMRAKGEETLKEVLKGVMKLVGHRECEDSMNISARVSKVLCPKELCEFTVTITRYCDRGHQALPAWISALLEVPLHWADQQLSARCLGSLMMAIVESNFSAEHLALVQLMQVYLPVDETTILTFAERSGELLRRESLKPRLHAYTLEAFSQVEQSQGIPNPAGQEFCELVFATMKLIGTNATPEEILKLTLLLRELSPRRPKSLRQFVQLFAKFASEERLRTFGFGALDWLFPNAAVREDVTFALSLFQQLAGASDFEETASIAGELLREIAKAETPLVFEGCLREMLTLGARMHQAAEVCLFFVCYEAGTLVPRWKALLRASNDKSGVVDAVAPVLAKLRSHSMQHRYKTTLVSASLHLCDSENVASVFHAIEMLIDNPETTSLLEVLYQLQEPELVKGFIESVQQFPYTMAVAIQLASLFVELEAQGLREGSIPANVKVALLHQTEAMRKLLPDVMALQQEGRNQMGVLCVKVLGELGDRGAEAAQLLAFVCGLARDLVESAQPSSVTALCNAVLAARDEVTKGTVRSLKNNQHRIKEKLVALLNSVQDRVTLQDVDALIPKHTYTRELANVQPTLIRFFDFAKSQWGQPVKLQREILANSSSSSFTILDDGTVFCCGGTFQAGSDSSASKALAATYILSREGTVTELPPMKGARQAHGVIFIDYTNTVYVFGGSSKH